MSDETPIKIEILPEETDNIPVVEDPPLVPEQPGRDRSGQVKQAAGQAGQQVAGAAKKAWDTEARRKVTGGICRGTRKVVGKGTRLVQDKVVETAERQTRTQMEAVQTRIKETDWQAEARTGTARALRWLSQRFASLAARLTPAKEPTVIVVAEDEVAAPPPDTEAPAS